MWLILSDPCGLTCYIFGFCVVLFVDFVTLSEVVWPWLGAHWSGPLHVLFFQTVIALICASYIKAATTDPGSVALRSASRADLYAPEADALRLYKPRRRFCEKCECVKPPRAHHCSTCKRCVNKMDHHCPWVNNCVGSNNLKFFLLFLLYVCVGGVYAAAMAGARVVTCWRAPPGACPEPSLYSVVVVVLAAVLGVFFAIFTVTMAYDQWEGAVTSTTGIESMKGWAEERRPLAEALAEIFGERPSWRWLAPTDIHETGAETGFYAWAPGDDMDAYDTRDPAIGRHFTRIEGFLAQQAEAQTREDAELARREAVAAAAEIHRRHAIKRGPALERARKAAEAEAEAEAAGAAAQAAAQAADDGGEDDASGSGAAGGGEDAAGSEGLPSAEGEGAAPAAGAAPQAAVASGGQSQQQQQQRRRRRD